MITGEQNWCQLFSKPGSDSDLAGLNTRPEGQGDGNRTNGQRVRNISARLMDFGILMARADGDVREHPGTRFSLIDMRQPSIRVRPLRHMNGQASFDEVLMTDAGG